MSRATALEHLLRSSPQLWTARQLGPLVGPLGQMAGGQRAGAIRVRDTGFAALNRLLPGQGWPLSSLIELLPAAEGIGEVRLVLPTLKQLCQEARDIVFVRPPHVPYPPALAKAGLPLNRILWVDVGNDEDARWVAEQTLRQGMSGAVLVWSDCTKDLALRRLQLAAREGDALAFLYRSPNAKVSSSPAALRLALSAAPSALPGALKIDLLKVQGGRAGEVLLPAQEAA